MSEAVAGSGLRFVVERKGDAAVVRCRGRLVSGVSDRFYKEIKQLIPGSKRIVLDFAELTHMDSMGIGALVRLYVSAKSAGCVLELNNIGKPIRHLLGVTHLISVLTVIGENNIKIV